MKSFIKVFIFCVGLGLCFYPLIASYIESDKQEDIITTYQQIVEKQDGDRLTDLKEKAVAYNDTLYQSNGYLIGDARSKMLSRDYYDTLMNIDSNNVMGYIEIPKIDVKLPIYHGTEEDVLSVGVGHLYGSSLPVGGASTRVVLTGHRGLPNSKLFTRLDELQKDDLFYVYTLNEVKAYSVIEIEVIEPTQTDKLAIRPDEDLVTLVTCTPYGINTHRLLVTGERVSFQKQYYDGIEKNSMSFRELFFTCVPFLFAGYGMIKIGIVMLKKRR